MEFICSRCGEKAIVNSEEELKSSTYFDATNVCYHNWIRKRKFSEKSEEVNSVIDINYEEIEDNLNKEVSAELVPYSLQDQQRKARENYLSELVSYNEVDKMLETAYNEIKNSIGIDASISDFKEVMESISKYDKKNQGYMSLIQSKLVSKYTTITISKSVIGLERVLSNLLESMMERSKNMGEDAEGDNNFKLVTTALKFYNEGLSILERLGDKYTIPETDRKLDDIKNGNVEKEQIELSTEDLQKLLNLANKKEE